MEVQLNERFVKRIAKRVKEKVNPNLLLLIIGLEKEEPELVKEKTLEVEKLIIEEFTNSNAFGNKPSKSEIKTIFEEVMREA